MSETNVVRREDSRIILALDVDSVERAIELMEQTKEHVGMVKIGLELINAQIAGEVARIAHAKDFEVFWDVKLNDIPTTMKKSVLAALRFNPRFIDVHASAGVAGIKSAVETVGEGTNRRVAVLAVTVLTSLDNEDCNLVFNSSDRQGKILLLVGLALEGGAQGIVCSAKELQNLKKQVPAMLWEPLIKVVPGTRSPGVGSDDQKNVTTAAAAVRDGADWLVIGREITAPETEEPPGMIAARINRDVAEALKAMKGAAV